MLARARDQINACSTPSTLATPGTARSRSSATSTRWPNTQHGTAPVGRSPGSDGPSGKAMRTRSRPAPGHPTRTPRACFYASRTSSPFPRRSPRSTEQQTCGRINQGRGKQGLDGSHAVCRATADRSVVGFVDLRRGRRGPGALLCAESHDRRRRNLARDHTGRYIERRVLDSPSRSSAKSREQRRKSTSHNDTRARRAGECWG